MVISFFNYIYFFLFLLLVLVYVGAWIVEKRREVKSRKDFDDRQERYKKMI